MSSCKREITPQITVIMPVYNAESFLPRCLYSIMKQTYRGFRVIAVNDGSTDRSSEILERFRDRHPEIRFTVLHQDQQGQAAARNRALDMADTEYVTFLDADDFLAPTFLEELYRASLLEDADISCCFHQYFFPESRSLIPHALSCAGTYTTERAMHILMHDWVLQSYLWNKLFRRKLFEQDHVRFPEMYFEDLAVTHRLFLSANRITVIRKKLYYYTQNRQSTLKTPNYKKINDFLKATASFRINLEKNSCYAPFAGSFGWLCRKTGLYSSYFLIKYHLTIPETHGFLQKWLDVIEMLRFYQSEDFHAEEWFSRDLRELPDAIQTEIESVWAEPVIKTEEEAAV